MTEQGWYPDPADPRRVRWWNGDSWSDATMTRPHQSAGRSAGSALRVILACVCGLVAVAVIGFVMFVVFAMSQFGSNK